MDKVYVLAVKNESLEEPAEVFVRVFTELEKALEAQEEAVGLEISERSDEELARENFEDEHEVLLSDAAGGYVVFSVAEVEVE